MKPNRFYEDSFAISGDQRRLVTTTSDFQTELWNLENVDLITKDSEQSLGFDRDPSALPALGVKGDRYFVGNRDTDSLATSLDEWPMTGDAMPRLHCNAELCDGVSGRSRCVV